MAAGAELVTLNDDLLEKDVKARQSALAEKRLRIEKARLDLKRAEELFERKSVSEQDYDNARYALLFLEQEAAQIEVELERLDTEWQKKRLFAPFDGVVVEKRAEVGEWLGEGGVVATLARTDPVSIRVEAPQGILPFERAGDEVRVLANGGELPGARVAAVLPRGAVETRTFPVKILLPDPGGLLEGMEARVWLPVEPERECLIVPRDALVT